MPPCHGGDRRFESGRARQQHKKATYYGWFCFLPSEISQRMESEIRYRVANAIVAAYLKKFKLEKALPLSGLRLPYN
jgi:hypothetical protein